MDFLGNLASGFGIALTPWNLLYAAIGALLGTAVGVLPGLGPSATIAMLLPVTFTIPPVSAVIMLAGIFYGAMYGGSTTSILLNIPGEAASIVTCLDGYQMARKGRAGVALGISAIGSFVASTFGVFMMSIVAPALATFAIEFGYPEYTSLVIVGLMLSVYLSEGSVLKGLLMGALGLVLGTVGLDPVFGAKRFTFGLPNLMDGVNFVIVAMGLFGIAEVFSNLENPEVRDVFKTTLRGLLPNREDWRRSIGPITRGSILGFFIGILPGGAAGLSSFVSYAIEKRISKHPEDFGTGAIEGVAGPESANNGTSSSSFIPLLTLGVPGNPAIAMIFVAMMIHGVRPGPLLFQEHPDLFWGVIASMYVGNVMLLLLNLPLISLWVKMLEIPYRILAILIVIFCVIGAYSINNNVFDVGTMVFFGGIGYVMRKTGFPPAPLVLAMVLGSIFELSLQQSILMSGGDLSVFVVRPISAFFLALAAFLVLKPTVVWLWRKRAVPQCTP